jgi:hypothetical protein
VYEFLKKTKFNFSLLYSREILTTVHYEKIEYRNGVRERNMELLRILPRRGPTAFPELINVLRVSF